MKRSMLGIAISSLLLATLAPMSVAQTTSSSTGGAGGAGGSAAGGIAVGGSANNTNATTGVSEASGGGGGSANGGEGGSANAAGGNVGSVSTGGSSASLGNVNVNFNPGSQALGRDGLGVGVDATTGAIVTDTNIKYSGSYKLKNTPNVSVGGPASGPCNGFSAGIGVSVAGIGVSGNTSTVDEGCAARETARIAAMLGRLDIANAVLENLPAVQAAMRAKQVAQPSSELPSDDLVPAVFTTLVAAPPAILDDPRVDAARKALLVALANLEIAERGVADTSVADAGKVAPAPVVAKPVAHVVEQAIVAVAVVQHAKVATPDGFKCSGDCAGPVFSEAQRPRWMPWQ